MIRRLLAVFLSIAVTLIAVHPAQAHHYIYLAEDPEWQKTNWPGTENGVFWRWAWDASDMKWWAPDGSFRSDVAAVLSRFYTAVPLPYDPNSVANEADADLTFAEVSAPCGNASVAGCTIWTDFKYHNSTHASYIGHAAIEIRSNLTYRKLTIAHELGHFYGLHERYTDNGGEPRAPNASELSIMDSYNPDEYLLDGPTVVDRTRLRAFWGQSDVIFENGQYPTLYKGDMAITGTKYEYCDPFLGCDYIATFSWRDLAWGEQTHAVGFWYSANGTNWELNPFLSRDHILDVGLHFYLGGDRVDLGDITLQESIYPRSDRPAGWFKMCGNPYFPRNPGPPPVGQWGNFRCSNPVYVP